MYNAPVPDSCSIACAISLRCRVVDHMTRSRHHQQCAIGQFSMQSATECDSTSTILSPAPAIEVTEACPSPSKGRETPPPPGP